MKNFEQFVVEMEPMISTIIHNLQIYKNQEDYYQVGLINLWKAYETFDPEKGTLKQYTFNCIRYSILNELKKDMLKEEREVISNDIRETSFVEELATPAALHEIYIILKDLMRRLPTRQQHFLELHYVSGLKLTEMTDVFQVSYSTIKSWKRELKERVYEYWDESD